MKSMLAREELTDAVQSRGFAIVEGFLDDSDVAYLLAALERHYPPDSSLGRIGETFALRNLLDMVPEVEQLANAPQVRALVEPALGSTFLPVRGILFDKIPEANWKVPWHQDVTIAVKERVDADGFGPWTTKAGVFHV